ncbi:MAG: hypothetical protein IPL35_15900 [Sphingobacteriales bacterium]|nr:hypothetical protein [Sphingobacteriales bacterium]
MKKSFVFYGFALLLWGILSAACKVQQEPLEGTWERVGDNFAGFRVLYKGGKGELIKINERGAGFGYAVGDVKWSEVRATGAQTYHFKDLRKSNLPEQGLRKEQGDATMQLRHTDTLYIKQERKINEQWGTEQIWVRVK